MTFNLSDLTEAISELGKKNLSSISECSCKLTMLNKANNVPENTLIGDSCSISAHCMKCPLYKTNFDVVKYLISLSCITKNYTSLAVYLERCICVGNCNKCKFSKDGACIPRTIKRESTSENYCFKLAKLIIETNKENKK